MIAGTSGEKKSPLMISICLFLIALHLSFSHAVGETGDKGYLDNQRTTTEDLYRGVRKWVTRLRAGDYEGILEGPEAGSIPGDIEDFSIYVSGLAAYETGMFELGEDYRTQLAANHPESIFGYYLTVDAVYHLLKAGRLVEAKKLAGRKMKRTPVVHREGSRLLFLRGRLLLDADREAEGIGFLVQCVKRYPGTEPALLAEDIVLPLITQKGGTEGNGKLVQTALDFGIALAGEGKFQESANILDLWRKKAGVRIRGQFDLALADSLRRMNRYTEAIRILSGSAEGEPRPVVAKKRFFAGIYNWYRGRTEEAERILKGVLAEFGGTDSYYRAAYNLGRISEEKGRFQDAFAYYDTASNSKGRSVDHESSFRKGLAKFLLESYGEAEMVFTRNLERHKDEEHYFRNLFMKAYSLEKKGDSVKARAIYERIASEKKGGIYYFYALRKLGKFAGWKRVGTVPFRDVTSLGYLEMLLENKKKNGDDDRRLKRALIFQKLGLFAFSLEELASADPRSLVPVRAGRKIRSAIFAYASGNFRRGIELSVDGGQTLALKGVPFLDSLSYIQYPALPFVINREAGRKVDPFFLHAVFRQESLFEYGVVSNAGAIGLGQIMPRTGQWIAKQMRRNNFSMEVLFDPVTNSSFSSYYLGSLIELFRGDFILAAAAYNAGEAAAKKWRKKSGGDPYLFTEIIGYEETRKYVRKVFLNYLSYLRIYGEGWEDFPNVKKDPGGTS